MITDDGVIIRINSDDVTAQSRYGSGVRVMRVPEGGRIVTLARVPKEDESSESNVENPSQPESGQLENSIDGAKSLSEGMEQKLVQAVQDFADFALEQQEEEE